MYRWWSAVDVDGYQIWLIVPLKICFPFFTFFRWLYVSVFHLLLTNHTIVSVIRAHLTYESYLLSETSFTRCAHFLAICSDLLPAPCCYSAPSFAFIFKSRSPSNLSSKSMYNTHTHTHTHTRARARTPAWRVTLIDIQTIKIQRKISKCSWRLGVGKWRSEEYGGGRGVKCSL